MSVSAPPRDAAFGSRWLEGALRALLAPLPQRRLCVAFSGGLDSTALLAALAARRGRDRGSLRALHVNHQMQQDSGQWARAALASARALGVPCQVLIVRVPPTRGQSMEALARAQRYEALAAALSSDEVLLTAHHQEDQLETLLLALMRGSGLPGLAAMRPVTRWAHSWLLRPLLPVSRADLQRYCVRRGLAWSEDPSNADEHLDRNYLRQRVVPLLRARWPAAAATGARSAQHLAQAAGLLEQQLQARLCEALDGAALQVTVLRRWPLALRGQVLRQWLRNQSVRVPDQRRLLEIAGPMLAARADASPRVRWAEAEVRRFNGRLHLFAQPAVAAPAAPARTLWRWRRRAWFELPSGAIGLKRDPHGEVRLDLLPPRLQVQFRRFGEPLEGPSGRLDLKALLQAESVPPWERSGVPLLLHGRQLIAVADLWLDPVYRGSGPPATGQVRGRFLWRRGTVTG